MIAADYIGLGDSELANSYFVRDSIEQATFDLYVAAMKFLEQQGKKPSALTTLGWSQGGYSNMILLGKRNGEVRSAGNDADHRATYVHALIDAKPWMDDQVKQAQTTR